MGGNPVIKKLLYITICSYSPCIMTELYYNKIMDDRRYFNYMKSYVLGSLKGQKEAGLIDVNQTEREHLLNEGIGVFLELAGHGYYEDYGYDVDDDNEEWFRQTRAYIEDTIGRELTEREIGVYYSLI